MKSYISFETGRAFSAGGDLDWLIERHTQSDKMEENSKTMVNFYKMFLSLRTLECPVIAAINGPAIGAGQYEYSLNYYGFNSNPTEDLLIIFQIKFTGFCVAIGGCDIRIASKKAKMGLNFVKIGLHPGKPKLDDIYTNKTYQIIDQCNFE